MRTFNTSQHLLCNIFFCVWSRQNSSTSKRSGGVYIMAECPCWASVICTFIFCCVGCISNAVMCSCKLLHPTTYQTPEFCIVVHIWFSYSDVIEALTLNLPWWMQHLWKHWMELPCMWFDSDCPLWGSICVRVSLCCAMESAVFLYIVLVKILPQCWNVSLRQRNMAKSLLANLIKSDTKTKTEFLYLPK